MTSSTLDHAGKNQSTPNIPSRGKVLCIFDDATLVRDVESAITAGGYALLRARHGMHGYWMAITGTPDVIVTDVSDPEQESNYLLDCLNRNAKTRRIPVVALVDAGHQRNAKVSCLRNATVCVRRDIEMVELLQHVERLVELEKESPESVEQPRVRSVDAFFSELGHKRSRSPRIVTRMLKSQLQRAQLVSNETDEQVD